MFLLCIVYVIPLDNVCTDIPYNMYKVKCTHHTWRESRSAQVAGESHGVPVQVVLLTSCAVEQLSRAVDQRNGDPAGGLQAPTTALPHLCHGRDTTPMFWSEALEHHVD